IRRQLWNDVAAFTAKTSIIIPDSANCFPDWPTGLLPVSQTPCLGVVGCPGRAFRFRVRHALLLVKSGRCRADPPVQALGQVLLESRIGLDNRMPRAIVVAYIATIDATMDALRGLRELAFTEYEARAYVALIEGGELNGYALAKATGIPRANIYAVADKLVQRGAARRAEHSAGVAFVAIAPKRFLRSIEVSQRQLMRAAQHALARLSRRRPRAAVLNLRDDEVLASARQLIDDSKKSLLIALQPDEAAVLADHLRQARERDVVITTLCLEGCSNECGGCSGKIYRHRLVPPGDARWLLLVCDGHAALLGHIAPENVTGVLTEQVLVVELASAYIRQSVTLAMLGSELAGQFTGLLSAETRRLLDGLYPDGDFLARMRELSDATSTSA
ncbi:MAG: helix-turn-helix domain-containing protein, partial [Rhodanobacteraceae bacterium]